MTRAGRVWMAGAAALMVALPSAGWGQARIQTGALEIEFGGYVHTQLNTTSADAELVPASEFLVRRARLVVDLVISDLVTGRLQPAFDGGDAEVKDAYMQLNFAPGLRATLGQFKRPFDLFELTSSTRIPVIERDGNVRGVDACAGVGGICSYSRFTERLEFADRDIGVMLDGRAGDDRFEYMFAVTNGAGDNSTEDSDGKSLSGRLAFTPGPDVTVAGNLGLHDYVTPAGSEEYAIAFAGDIEWGTYTEGLHVLAGFAVGENWLDLDPTGDPSGFFTLQGIVSYRSPLTGGGHVRAIEPVGRLSWSDPDDDVEDDSGLLLTPGVMLHFTGRNKIALNLDVWAPAEGDTEWSLKAQSYLHF